MWAKLREQSIQILQKEENINEIVMPKQKQGS
jgi:hypothetical protein